MFGQRAMIWCLGSAAPEIWATSKCIGMDERVSDASGLELRTMRIRSIYGFAQCVQVGHFRSWRCPSVSVGSWAVAHAVSPSSPARWSKLSRPIYCVGFARGAPKWRLKRHSEQPAPTRAPFMGRPTLDSLPRSRFLRLGAREVVYVERQKKRACGSNSSPPDWF